jgi:phosphorylcholine metabolism protein LicD
MLKVFINICEFNNIKPVLAHGGLIGHYFNNKMLPWDDDIDLVLIGKSINNFLRLDLKKINSNKHFFLEINPNSLNRNINDRVNIIDARFISKKYGFFIDITFLTENKGLTKKQGKNIINCKSPHYYFLEDFYPLKKEKFEEMEIYIPNKIKNVLSYEYGNKVFLPKYRNWIFKDNLWQRK